MSDAVTQWNDVLLDVIRDIGGAPGPLARGGAMMHAAIHDAVQSIEKTHAPYLELVPAAKTASIRAAIAHAAHDTLAAAFPSTTIDLTKKRDATLTSLGASTSTANITAGTTVGKAVAQTMIGARTGDGSADTTPYVAGTQPGDWRPTGSGAPATPNWPKVTPFAVPSATQFRPPRPGGYRSKTEMLRSREYAAQLNEVKRLGRSTSTARTQEESEIAVFWANDVDDTYKPPGQLFTITKTVSEQRRLKLLDNARLFALVALAMADASIVAWDAKYATDIDLWRPETAIRLADTDGNLNTKADPGWEPLSRNDKTGDRFSPAFPAYVSGHATFGAAHAAVMRRYFGTDNVTFTATTEDPHAKGVTRTFNSFTDAALENGRSRVYLGVHFQWDGDHGFHSGTALGEHVVETRLQPLP